MTMSTPAALWFSACFTDPARAAISIPCSWTCSMTSSGGVPERVGHQRDLVVAQNDLDQRRRRGRRPAQQLAPGPALELGHAVVGQDLLGEGAVLVGDHRPELLFELDRVQLAHALVFAGMTMSTP